MPIALDVMGGDFSPQNPVEAAVLAVNNDNIDIILVGDIKLIEKELNKYKFNAKKINIIHATEVVEMGESPILALRNKKDSSMRVAYDLHKSGQASAVVSAGNSGAMLAIGKYVLKNIHGISRPCITATLPSLKDKVVLLDAGANMDCTSQNLFEFAIMGDVYAEQIHSIQNPRIALLNIGSEEGKGTETIKKTYQLLKESTLNFVGNIEGKNFFEGDADVVVADGFAGNVLLKSVQGGAKYVTELLKKEILSSMVSKFGALLLSKSFKELKKKTNYAAFGGAPLLGLKGVSIVCHGISNPEAIHFGIKFANWASKANIVSQVEEKIISNQLLLTPIEK